MKALVKLFAIAFVMLTAGSASAETNPPSGPSCKLQSEQLGTCSNALSTCQQDQNILLDYAIKWCPNFSDMTKDQLRDHAKKGDDPKPKKPRTPKSGGDKVKVVVKPPVKPDPPKAETPSFSLLIGRHEAFAANAECPYGGYRLPIGLDANGNGKLDAKEVKDRLPACKGKDGKDGTNGANARTTVERFKSDSSCHGRGGSRTTSWTDLNGNGKPDTVEKPTVAIVCDGGDGSAGRPGENGSTRVQFGLGMRAGAVWSKDRPPGLSAAPEAQLELWLAPTVEFVSGIAWAPGGDRNMVVTGQLRYRALGKRLGLGVGVQYQAWNLEGNKALWQSVLGMGSVQLVLVDSQWVDVSVDAGLLLGIDGYDKDAQFAIGATGGLNASLKF